jgi:ribulose-bisphosphate carboxylase small chain
MRLTQGQFSFLPDLTDAEIKKQIDYALQNGWAIAIEYTDDPHPKNYFWSMWGQPMFDLKDPAAIMLELNACRAERANTYIKIQAFDSRKGWESIRMSFLVNRPTRRRPYHPLHVASVRSRSPARPSLLVMSIV